MTSRVFLARRRRGACGRCSAMPSVADSYAVFLIATISLTAIACIGLNVLLGLAGQISLGHIGFMAIGAYTTVLLMEKAGWPYLAATAAAIVLVSVVGGLLAMPALRVRGPYLAMVTIAFGFIVEHGTIEWRDLTGGGNGLILTVPPAVFGLQLSERALAIAGVVLGLCRPDPVRAAEAQRLGLRDACRARHRGCNPLDRHRSRAGAHRGLSSSRRPRWRWPAPCLRRCRAISARVRSRSCNRSCCCSA